MLKPVRIQNFFQKSFIKKPRFQFIFIAISLIFFSALSAGADISKEVSFSTSFSNTTIFNIPAGLSINVSISASTTGSLSITSPGGKTLSVGVSGTPSESTVTLNEIGTYNVSENYTVKVTGVSALTKVEKTVSASGSWSFTNTEISKGKVRVSSSVSGIIVDSVSGSIAVSLNGNSIPMSATITTTAAIPPGDSVSASVSGNWNVASSISLEVAPSIIKVNTNVDNGSFSISGPASYSGSGRSWMKEGAPVGNYTITYNPLSGYDTPESQAGELTSGGTLTFSGEYIPITGVISVETNLDEARFNLSGPYANYTGNGKSWQRSAIIGVYTISYESVSGYETPASETRSLSRGEKISFIAEYKKLLPGTIEVRTNLSLAKFSLSGPANYAGNGESWTKTQAIPGEYTITYDALSGYESPRPETKILPSGGQIAFEGNYIKILPGSIQVNTNLDDAAFTIIGPEIYNGQGKSWVKSDVPAGTYVITYHEVERYKTPSPETKRMGSGEGIVFNAEYIVHKGTINVETNLDNAAFRLAGPSEYSGAGRYWIRTDAPVGEYTIDYEKVPGYETPSSESKVLNPNGTLTFKAEYKNIVPGTIEVITNSDNAKFRITGPTEYSGSGKYWTQAGAKPGEYTIAYGAVADYDAPASETRIMTLDNMIRFTGKYKIHTGSISVTTNIDGAKFLLFSSQQGQGAEPDYTGRGKAWKKDDVPVGNYTIIYGDVPYYISPPQETQKLISKGNIAFNAEYKPVPPRINHVTLSGSPAKSGGIVGITVMGDAGCIATYKINQDIKGSLTELAESPGIYMATFNTPKEMDIRDFVRITLTNSSGISSEDSSQSITIDTIARISSVEVSDDNPDYGDIVTIEITGDPKSSVSFSLKGVLSSKMQELSGSPGTYTAQIKIMPSMREGKKALEITLLDPSGNSAANNEYSITIGKSAGIISVNANIDQAAFSLAGPAKYEGKGKSWAISNAEIGDYTITYGEVPGYRTPPEERKNLSSGGRIDFDAEYVPITGNIKVYTNLDNAAFRLSGSAVYESAGRYWTQASAITGSYTITYGEVGGYKTPPSETGELKEGDTLSFRGAYTPLSGIIIVNTNLDESAYTISDLYAGAGTFWMQESAVSTKQVDYTITYFDVPGYITPPSETKKMGAGEKIIFHGEYKPLGNVEVTTNLDASFVVLSAEKIHGGKEKLVLKGVPTGKYIVTYQDMPGYITPPSESKVLERGESISFYGEYRLPGSIRVTTNLANATFSISGLVSSKGSGNLWTYDSAPAGEYTIIYGDVSGYIIPSAEAKTLKPGDTLTFSGEYSPAPPPGNIHITTNLASASYVVSYKGVRYNGMGDSWRWIGAPVGEYIVIYNDLPGYITPLAESGILGSGKTIAFNGEYRLSSGNINVLTNINASFIVKSPDTLYTGSGSEKSWSDAPAGEYTISYGDVPGYLKPSSISKRLSAGEAIAFIGEYTPIPNTIRVLSNINQASFSLSGPLNAQGEGRNWAKTGFPAGRYTITFGRIPGYETPSAATKTLNESSMITFIGGYKPMVGNIKVSSNIDQSAFDLYGPVSFNGAGTLWEEDIAPSGEYTIIFHEVPGYTTPEPQTKKLAAGGTSSFDGIYLGISSGTITVKTNIGAKFNISGPASYAGKGDFWRQAEAPIGEYTITYADVPEYRTPSAQKMKLSDGGIIDFTGEYLPLYGAISVHTNLANAKYRITGIASYDGGGKEWMQLDVPPGEYKIIYDDIEGYITPPPETNLLKPGQRLAFIGAYSISDKKSEPEILLTPLALKNELLQNFPNPCNPETWIPFKLSQTSKVILSIYDINGRLIRRMDLGYKEPGIYASKENAAYWDGSNEYGEKAVSGVYFYSIVANEFTMTRKMVITR